MVQPKGLKVNLCLSLHFNLHATAVVYLMDFKPKQKLTIAQLQILLEPLNTVFNMFWRCNGRKSFQIKSETTTIWKI